MKRNPQIRQEEAYRILKDVFIKAGFDSWEKKERVGDLCKIVAQTHLKYRTKTSYLKLERFRSRVLQYRENQYQGYVDISEDLLKRMANFLGISEPEAQKAFFESITRPTELEELPLFNQIHAKILKKDVQELNNTFWLLYRRSERERHALVVDLLCIYPPNKKKFNVAHLWVHDQVEDKYIGVATTDQIGDHFICLFVEDRNVSTSQLYMHLIARLAPNRTKQEIAIGHLTYVSPTRKKLLSKVVVLERLVARDRNEALASRETVRKNPPDEIEAFLRDRTINRMTSPNELITNLMGLGVWIRGQRDAVNAARLAAFKGVYTIHYRFTSNEGVQKIASETLKIEVDAHRNIAVTLILTNPQADERILKGEVSVNTPFATFFFKNPAGVDVKTIHLKIRLPSPGYAEQFECTTGIISGSDLPNNHLYSFIVLLIRHKGSVEDMRENKRVIQFFEHFGSKGHIRPPLLEHFKLSDLDFIVSQT